MHACIAAALLIASVVHAQSDSVQREPIAVIVHAGTPVDNVSLEELRGIFLADRQFWSDNTRIRLFMNRTGTQERNLVLNRLYQMSELRFRQYWLGQMMQTNVPRGPADAAAIPDLVSATPGAIAFVRADLVTDQVRVLRIDGFKPGDPGYVFRQASKTSR